MAATNNTQIGKHAITVMDYDSWYAIPTAQPRATRTRKTRGVKEIVHPIFTDCAGVITDPFWIEIFRAASFGKLPAKFSFLNGHLAYKRGAKNCVIEVSNDPHQAVQDCMNFFKVNGGIFSPTDGKIAVEAQHALSPEAPEEITWGSINKKVQECMVEYFIADTKEIMGLSPAETIQLRQTVKLAIINKDITKENIFIANRRIVSMVGLTYISEGGSTTFHVNSALHLIPPMTNKGKGEIVRPKDMIPQFIPKWEKYLSLLESKASQYNPQKITVNYIGSSRRQVKIVSDSDSRQESGSNSDQYDPSD